MLTFTNFVTGWIISIIDENICIIGTSAGHIIITIVTIFVISDVVVIVDNFRSSRCCIAYTTITTIIHPWLINRFILDYDIVCRLVGYTVFILIGLVAVIGYFVFVLFGRITVIMMRIVVVLIGHLITIIIWIVIIIIILLTAIIDIAFGDLMLIIIVGFGYAIIVVGFWDLILLMVVALI